VPVTTTKSKLEWPGIIRLILSSSKLETMMQSPTLQTIITQIIYGIQALLALNNPFPDSMEHDIMIKKIMQVLVSDLIKELGMELTLI
jgi:hypothetical protein